jgi:serine O-acetyltransferase
MYLYLLANTAFKLGGEKNLDLARKAYLLNKALHGLEVFYENNLPEIFWFAHSVGSVIGRASYGNRLMVMQGCTVGNKGGKYPVFGDRVVLCAGSKVLGGVIGSGVCIGAGSLLIEETIPDNSIVVGSSPNIRVLQRKSQLINRYFSE